MLYRTRDITRSTLCIFNKKTWKILLEDFKKNSDTWILIPPTEYHERSALISFPSTLVPEKRDEEALLTHQSCNGALDRLHNFLGALLKG